jgi:hypothetical protein
MLLVLVLAFAAGAVRGAVRLEAVPVSLFLLVIGITGLATGPRPREPLPPPPDPADEAETDPAARPGR